MTRIPHRIAHLFSAKTRIRRGRRLSLTFIALASIGLCASAGLGCNGGLAKPDSACGVCSKGRLCEGQVCVCAPPPRPCSPSCAPADPSCDRGSYDAERCQCALLPATATLESLELLPNPVLLKLGGRLPLQAFGSFSTGERLEITSSVNFSVSPPALGAVDGGGVFQAAAVGSGSGSTGSGRILASVGSLSGETRLEVSAGLPQELRGVWVTRWNYNTESALRSIVQQAADSGFNAIFLQVRGTADAYYQSNLEPWAAKLSGKLGKDPGWDPLGVALEAAHARGLTLHAWLNTVPIWSGNSPPSETVPRHLLLDHPEWLMVDDQGRRQQLGDTGYLCLSPGIPAARAHLLAVMNDLLTRYPVDGLHLDYIRYYGKRFSHDAVSEDRFAMAQATEPGLSWTLWQQRQVAEIVRGAYGLVQGFPGVRLTTAVWHNNNLAVAGSRGASDYYQDSHAWLAEGIVDAIVPMDYLRMDSNPGFDVLADDHLAHAAGRHVYLGIHVLGRQSNPDPSGTQMLKNIAYARSIGAQGVVLFAWSTLTDNGLLAPLKAGPFAQPAEPPPMTWR